MAFIELPQVLPGKSGRNGSYQLSTAVGGIAPDIYMISAYADNATITTLNTSASTIDIEVTSSPDDDVYGTSGIIAIWFPVISMTGAPAPKFYVTDGPITAIRVNVKTPMAGTLTISIRTDSHD